MYGHPTGVALGYSQLTDNDIVNLPVPKLQTNGFLFVWVINAKYGFTLDLFDRWGYTWVPLHYSPCTSEPPTQDLYWPACCLSSSTNWQCNDPP